MKEVKEEDASPKSEGEQDSDNKLEQVKKEETEEPLITFDDYEKMM